MVILNKNQLYIWIIQDALNVEKKKQKKNYLKNQIYFFRFVFAKC